MARNQSQVLAVRAVQTRSAVVSRGRLNIFCWNRMDELKDRLRDDELRREKMRLEKDQSETTCVELKRRMAALNAAHRRLERRSAEAEEGARQAADDLRLQLVSHQRIGHQLQLKLDHQAEHVKELEQALLGLGEDGKLSGWNRFCRQRSLPRIHPESDEFRSFDGFVLSTLERGQTKKTPGPGGRC